MVDLNQGEFIVSSIAYGSVTINVIDASGHSTTITTTGWYFSIQDPDTGNAISSESFLQYAGGGFAVQVVPLFANAGDYPSCGCLYQERLNVGGSNNNPTQLNGSVADDYPDFISDPNAEDYAYQFTLVSNQVNQLLNMVGTPNALVIGTSGGLWIVSGNGAAITQVNVNASQQSSQGVSVLQPQVVNGSAIFVSRSTRIVTFLIFNFVTNQWENADLTRLNRNITIGTSEETSGISQTAFQMEPYPIYWAVRNDGQLIGLVFNTQDQVFAWFRVNMTDEGGVIESVAVVTGQGQEDQVVVVVNRTINGVTQRYVEYFMPQELFGQLSNAFFVHCGLQWNGGPGVAITGISQANPTVVTAPSHGFSTGYVIQITEVQGMTQINQGPASAYTITVIDANNFSLNGMDSTAFSPYTSGGIATQVTNTVTGLEYIAGQNAQAVGDGAIIWEGVIPSSGTVSFNNSYYANLVTIGLPFKTIIEPLNPIIGNQMQTSKGKKQKISRATFSLFQSMGGLYGTDQKHLHPLIYAQGSTGSQPQMFTGNITRDLDGNWEDEDSISIVHAYPFPFTLRAVVPRLDVADAG